MSYEINGIKYDYDSITNQRIKEKFVDREVYSNVNTMVEYILSKSWDDRDTPFSWDDVENCYTPKCPECDSSHTFEEIDTVYKCLGCDEIFDEKIQECPECLDNEENFEELDTAYKCTFCSHMVESLDDVDTKKQEVYQWFIVSNFLCEKLKIKGEPVIYDENIWGRTCCGQAILLDYVISEICYEIEILEGQKYSWEEREAG